jgi:hypothetical protein
MIYKIFPDEVFAENAMSIASYLSQMPTKGLAYTKSCSVIQQEVRLKNNCRMKISTSKELPVQKILK